MGILRLETEKGPIIVEVGAEGLMLGFVPTEPSEDDVNDIWNTGLRFSAIAKGLHCLEGGPKFTTKGFRISLQGGTARLGFEFNHRPGTYFEVDLDSEATERLRQHLSNALAGGKSAVVDGEQSATMQADIKVGRNDPCLCGSGKKYKRCCLGKKSHAGGTDAFSFVGQNTDPYVKALVADAMEHRENIQDSSFWMDLGAACGTAGNHESALTAFRNASTLSPDDDAIKVNIAATHGILGNHEEAFATLANAAANAPRKAIITGNLLQSLGRDAEAIPYFEEAIKEEPDFPLPYRNLLRSLEETNSPLVEYWLDRAIKLVPQSPNIAHFYCYYLLKHQRIQELADAEWIEHLTSDQGRSDVIGRNQEHPRLIVDAQLMRLCGLIWVSGSVERLEFAIAILASADPGWHLCDPATILTAAAANLGVPSAVIAAYDRVCSGCRSTGRVSPRSTYLARAYLVSENYSLAIASAEESLVNNRDDFGALSDYWWCLDEVGRLDEAVTVAQRVYELNPCESSQAYNLGWLCQKRGSWGLARYYYEKAVEQDPKNLWATENLAFALLLDSNINAAQSCWTNYEALFETKLREEAGYDDAANPSGLRSQASDGEFVSLKRSKWDELITAAGRSMGSHSYAMDLIGLNQASEPLVGSQGTIGTAQFSLQEILDALSGGSQEKAIEIKHQLQMQQRGDMSKVIAGLRTELSVWEALPEEARIALIEGERRISDKAATDHSTDIVSFAKAVEVSLRRKVFDAFQQECRTMIDLEKHLAVELQEKYTQARNFILFIKRGQHLELGSMTLVLKLCKGSTGRKLLLLGRLREFIEQQFPAILEGESIDDLTGITEFRNPAAHSDVFTESEARNLRTLAIRQLNRLSVPS